MSAPRTGATTVVTVLSAAILLSAGMVGCSRSHDSASQSSAGLSAEVPMSEADASVGGAAVGTNAGTSDLAPNAPGDGVVGNSNKGVTPPTGSTAATSPSS